ncbi:hypothetical protein BGX21_008529 [Mortierella sp. AD011]|nr:hypothetical protein BGX21_008529 [Mortierella sp. AD011]
MTQPFEINSTLWDILLGFERFSKSSNSPLNLTRSTGMPLQPPRKEFTSSQVYVMPVVKVLDQEYSSIQSLKSTSLKRAGLESGNTTLQVTMQHTNCSIESFMDEIESEHPLHSTSNGRVNSQRSPSQSSFHLQQQAPLMSSRGGSINLVSRDGPSNAGGASNDGGAGGSDGDAPRQTPTQDISSAMVEASQEIRQLREQQTQEAMTDRVKRLSKTSDSSPDKDRFVRSMDFCQPISRDGTSMGMGMSTGMGSSAVEMDIDSERNVPVPVRASSGSPSPHDDIVRQIAHRVSQKLREAQESGNSTASYHTLLAQEIAKGQIAGVLPSSPAGSRQNSVYINDPEDTAKPMKH